MFRVRTHRVLIRWRCAAARWKVEVHSFPTRRRTPPTDIGKYFSEPDEKKCSINYETHFTMERISCEGRGCPAHDGSLSNGFLPDAFFGMMHYWFGATLKTCQEG